MLSKYYFSSVNNEKRKTHIIGLAIITVILLKKISSVTAATAAVAAMSLSAALILLATLAKYTETKIHTDTPANIHLNHFGWTQMTRTTQIIAKHTSSDNER